MHINEDIEIYQEETDIEDEMILDKWEKITSSILSNKYVIYNKKTNKIEFPEKLSLLRRWFPWFFSIRIIGRL